MSLLPHCVQGATNDNYFLSDVEGVMRAPVIVPLIAQSPGGVGIQAASLAFESGATANPANQFSIIHFVPTASGGGLTAGAYMIYYYGVGFNSLAQQMQPNGGTANAVITRQNLGPQLDSTRGGVITGTGAPQAVLCPSIVAGSTVILSYVGGGGGAVAGLVASPPYIVTPNTSFSVTLPAGAIYNYQVLG